MCFNEGVYTNFKTRSVYTERIDPWHFKIGCFLSQNYVNFCERDREEFSCQKIGIFQEF